MGPKEIEALNAMQATDLLLTSMLGAVITALDSPALRARISLNLEQTAAQLLQEQNEQKLQAFLDLKDTLLDHLGMR